MAPAERITCPVCGGVNPPDAVFCGNPACHKALGGFRFVREELRDATSWHESLADRVTAFVGKPHFLVAHALWFMLWVGLNTGLFAVAVHFDDYPFGLLSFILAPYGQLLLSVSASSSQLGTVIVHARSTAYELLTALGVTGSAT